MEEGFQIDDGSLFRNPSEAPHEGGEELLMGVRGISAKAEQEYQQQPKQGGGTGGYEGGGGGGCSKCNRSTVAEVTLAAAKRRGTRNSSSLDLRSSQGPAAGPSSSFRAAGPATVLSRPWHSKPRKLDLEGDGRQSKLDAEDDGATKQVISSCSVHRTTISPAQRREIRKEGKFCRKEQEGADVYWLSSPHTTTLHSNGEMESATISASAGAASHCWREHGSSHSSHESASPKGGHFHGAQPGKRPPGARHVAGEASQPMGMMPTWAMDSCHHAVHTFCQQHYHHHQWLHGPSCYPCASSSPVCVMTSPHPPSVHHSHWAPAAHYYPSHLPSLLPEYHHAPVYADSAFHEEDLYASPLSTVFEPCLSRRRDPPFPSKYALPYVLCQHCSQLLSITAFPPHPNASLLKFRCGHCMRTSKFSTRHLHRTPTSAARGAGSTVADAKPAEPSPMPTDNYSGDSQHELEHHSMAAVDGISMPNDVEPHDSQLRSKPELASLSSVQDWVNCLAKETFVECPATVRSTGFACDFRLQGPLDWQSEGGNEGEKISQAAPRSPLHKHFGYKTPTELLDKVLSSEDDENRAGSETNSNASSSTTSTNTFRPVGFDNTMESAATPLEKGFKDVNMYPKRAVFADTEKSSIEAEQHAQSSLGSIFKRSLRDFAERRSPLVTNSKTRVIVNGHALSNSAIKAAEERAGRLRPGSYWYDCKAGFWGVVGGPCLGILPPFIEELNYPMSKNCSNGDTQVYVNGRELHLKDLGILSQRGLSKKPGRAYTVGFDGVVTDESSGLELKSLGKLAPTVERRGKGFGMFTADLHQTKLSA